MNKTYILTGGSDGLGAAFGQKCVENGIKIICLSRSKPNYDAIHIVTDLSVQSDIENAAQEVKEKYPFDALIHCAGIFNQYAAGEINYESIEKLFKVNVFASIYLTSQLFDHIKINNADILVTGSSIANKGYPELASYGASKWAGRGISQNFRAELKDSNCRVIQFNPGGFKSNMYKKSNHPDTDMSQFMDTKDIANIMYFSLQLPKNVEVSEIFVNRKV